MGGVEGRWADIDLTILDNSDEILAILKQRVIVALEECGALAEGYAVDLCPWNTGTLRGSIKYRRLEHDVYIGTNMEYAAYVEMGTGQHYPGGRQTPWSYQDEKGDWHRTKGQEAKPYLKPAVADHAKEYEYIMRNALSAE